MPGHIIILSGPSRSGKNSIATALVRDKKLNLQTVVTTTSRAPRPRERHGKDYIFISRKEFEEGIRSNKFLEWAPSHGEYYGIPHQSIDPILKKNKNVLLVISVNGMSLIKQELKKNIFTLFIMPSMLSELTKRMIASGFSAAERRVRLKTAREEIRHAPEFDAIIVNRPGQLALARRQTRQVVGAYLTQ